MRIKNINNKTERIIKEKNKKIGVNASNAPYKFSEIKVQWVMMTLVELELGEEREEK